MSSLSRSRRKKDDDDDDDAPRRSVVRRLCLATLTIAASISEIHAFTTTKAGPVSTATTAFAASRHRPLLTPTRHGKSHAVVRPLQAATTQSTTKTTTNVSEESKEEQQQQPQPQEPLQQEQEQEQWRALQASGKSYLDDGFVFGLEGSGLRRPRGKEASLVVEGDSLETKPHQVAMVTLTLMGHAAFAAWSFSRMLSTNGGDVLLTSVQGAALFAASWILADLGSGVLHWSVDNYGNGRTPVMGSIIAAFQGHHSAPWTITYRGFCNNVYKLCVPFGVATVGLFSAVTGPFATFSLTVFCVMEILSQEFHKWSHMTKAELPFWVNWLQDAGLAVHRVPHAKHHAAPYHGNYCIISGICNDPLDRSGVFRWMEHQIYKCNGVESNAWKLDEKLRERTLRGDYRFVQ